MSKLTVHFNNKLVLVLLDKCGTSGVDGAAASVTTQTSVENGPLIDSFTARNLKLILKIGLTMITNSLRFWWLLVFTVKFMAYCSHDEDWLLNILTI